MECAQRGLDRQRPASSVDLNRDLLASLERSHIEPRPAPRLNADRGAARVPLRELAAGADGRRPLPADWEGVNEGIRRAGPSGRSASRRFPP
jgi:hypothetical protein